MVLVIVIASLLALAALGAIFWVMWETRRDLKEIEQSLERLEDSLMALNYGLTILLYLTVRDKPDLLAKSPDLERKALEASERLGQKQLLLGGDSK